MALQCSQRNYDITNMMVRELAIRPASLPDDGGAKDENYDETVLKSNMKVELAQRHAS